MQRHGLLLQRHSGRRTGRLHDGKVVVMRSNLRWCSDVFEITCWNGEVVRIVFVIDAHEAQQSAMLRTYRPTARRCDNEERRTPIGVRYLRFLRLARSAAGLLLWVAATRSDAMIASELSAIGLETVLAPLRQSGVVLVAQLAVSREAIRAALPCS